MERRVSIVIAGLFLTIASAQAKLYVADSESKFYDYVDRHKIAIVHVNNVDVDKESAELEEMKQDFEIVSKDPGYSKSADIAFIGVNLDAVPELSNDFKLGGTENTALFIFKRGTMLKKGDEPIKKVGILSRTEMRQFIEDNVGSYVDDIIKEKDQQAQQRETQRVIIREQVPVIQREVVTQPVYYSQPTYYSDYGYYPYYRRPYFGIGIGFGRGWGWGGWGGRGWGWGGGRRGGWHGGRGGRGRR